MTARLTGDNCPVLQFVRQQGPVCAPDTAMKFGWSVHRARRFLRTSASRGRLDRIEHEGVELFSRVQRQKKERVVRTRRESRPQRAAMPSVIVNDIFSFARMAA